MSLGNAEIQKVPVLYTNLFNILLTELDGLLAPPLLNKLFNKEAAQPPPPKLILIIGMPQQDGMEVLQRHQMFVRATRSSVGLRRQNTSVCALQKQF